jgi:hypothetical protein
MSDFDALRFAALGRRDQDMVGRHVSDRQTL